MPVSVTQMGLSVLVMGELYSTKAEPISSADAAHLRYVWDAA